MATHKKPIYLCTGIEELNKQVETPSISTIQSSSAKSLLSSSDSLLKAARRSFDLGDEEQSYVLFMRVATLVTEIKKAKGYASDSRYFDSLANPSLLEAVTKCESLKVSLRQRYSLLSLANKTDSKLKEKEIQDALEMEEKRKAKQSNSKRLNGVIKPVKEVEDNVAEEDKLYTVTMPQIKNLVEQKATPILVIDCRGRHDFTSSHLNHPNCISIPQELLDPGMSANKIESKLKEKQPESYHAWNKRGTYDKVILYDWNSSYGNMQSSLATLFIAMTKWDHDTKYKSPPAILQGGIRNLYFSYPTLLNHPQNTSSDLDQYEEKQEIVNTSVNGSLSSKELKSLDSISYPNLDDDDSTTKQTKALNNLNNGSGGGSTRPGSTPNNLSGKYSGNNNTIPQPATTFVVDRSKKPKSANVPVHKNNSQQTNGPSREVSSAGSEVKVNGVASSSDATTAALNAALDDVIISTKELKMKEQELEDIINKSGEKQTHSEESSADREAKLRERLAEKEAEIERLTDVVKNRDSNLSTIKAEYDTLLASRTKPSLPQIRPTAADSSLDSKFKEKLALDDYVKDIRAKRKEAAAAETVKKNADKAHVTLPTIPGSGSSSPRPLSRSRVGKSESTTFPTITQNGGGEVKGTQSSSVLLRPMSQDATPISYQKLKDEPASGESPRSLLKRSHSHPNIPQSLSEDDPESNLAMSQPAFNRGLKPSASRPTDLIVNTPNRSMRQFHAVNSTEKHRTGLKNLGNTCYMNSIVQCLVHLPGLVGYFMGDTWKTHLRLHRSQKQKQITPGEVSIEFHAVVQEMNIGHRSIALMDFKNNVGRHESTFRGYEQQDSHEFLTMLLDWLHEELNTVSKMQKPREQNNDGLTDTDAANAAWAEYCGFNCSKIVELFCGQQKSAVRCQSCGKESVTFEPFFNLSVPIPSINNRKVDIYQCMDLYTTEEIVSGWSCPHCKSTVKATKKIDLWRLPPYLIIHLQRFYSDGWWKKRLTEVDFPVDNLDLTSRVKGSQISAEGRKPRSNFMLQAVSNHYGSMDGGHYTAYCRKNSNWARFDDHEVNSISSRDVTTPAAYIFFYCNNSP